MEPSQLTHLIAPLILALMMVGMGLSLVKSDFVRIAQQPKAVLLGSVLQLAMLPMIGFAIAMAFDLSPAIAVGVIILAACPGGPGSNLVSYIARGDAALSVTLTAISSLLTALTIPFIVNLGLRVFMSEEAVSFSVLDMGIKVFLITIPPILVGMSIRRKNAVFADKMAPFIKSGSMIFLLALIVSVALKEKDNIVDLVTQAGLPAVTLCLMTVLMGFIISKVFSLPQAQRKTIAIEVGLQNAALAIIIASSLLGQDEMAIPAAVYSPVMLFMALMFIMNAFFAKPTRD